MNEASLSLPFRHYYRYFFSFLFIYYFFTNISGGEIDGQDPSSDNNSVVAVASVVSDHCEMGPTQSDDGCRE